MNHPRGTVKVTADIMTSCRSTQRKAGLYVRAIKESISEDTLLHSSLHTQRMVSAATQKPASRAVALETWLRVVLHCHPPVNP